MDADPGQTNADYAHVTRACCGQPLREWPSGWQCDVCGQGVTWSTTVSNAPLPHLDLYAAAREQGRQAGREDVLSVVQASYANEMSYEFDDEAECQHARVVLAAILRACGVDPEAG